MNMVMFNRNYKKTFIDMQNLQIESQSIVLLDKVFNGQMPIGQFQFNKDTASFKDIATSSYLTTLMKDVFKRKMSFNMPIKDENAPQKIFNFEENIQFIYDILPSKFSIKHTTNGEDMKLVKEIFNNIIELDETKDQVSAIGINFEFFATELNNAMINTVFTNDVKDGLNATQISLLYIIDNIKTNLIIANAKKNETEGIYISVNFHIDIDHNQNIGTILDKDFITLAKSKINDLYP